MMLARFREQMMAVTGSRAGMFLGGFRVWYGLVQWMRVIEYRAASPGTRAGRSDPVRARTAFIICVALITAACAAPAELESPRPPAASTSSPALQLPPGEYHVAATGNDSAAGSVAAPWRTIAHAVSVVPSGSVILIGPGTYGGAEIRRPDLTLAASGPDRPVVQDQLAVRNTHDIVISGLLIEDVTETYRAALYVEDSARVTIEDNVLRGSSFGLHLVRVTDSVISDNEMTDNAVGIEVHYAGSGVVLSENRIHTNNRELDEHRGSTGVNFYYTDGPITLRANELIDNHGQNVEIYSASGVSIEDNRVAGAWDAIETGTDEPELECHDLRIVRNVFYRSSSGPAEQRGIYLRCASDSLVAHNTIDGMDFFAIGLSHQAGSFGGSIDGLRVLNNVLVNGRPYSIDTALPSSVVVDYNLVRPGSGPEHGTQIAWVAPQGASTSSYDTFRDWTGFDSHGLLAEPRFVSASTRDYRLQADSPAVDRGLVLSGVNASYGGAGPDLGHLER